MVRASARKARRHFEIFSSISIVRLRNFTQARCNHFVYDEILLGLILGDKLVHNMHDL